MSDLNQNQQESQSPDRAMFYTACGLGGFNFVVTVSHLSATYPEMRIGGGTIIGVMVSAVIVVTIVTTFIVAYTTKKFDRTEMTISLLFGVLMLFVLAVGLLVGAMV